jgi:ATP-dependent Clp protease protease subunit
MLALTDRLMDILARHAGQDPTKVKKDAERDYFLSAEEAKAYGIVDEVFAHGGESPIGKSSTDGDKPKK